MKDDLETFGLHISRTNTGFELNERGTSGLRVFLTRTTNQMARVTKQVLVNRDRLVPRQFVAAAMRSVRRELGHK